MFLYIIAIYTKLQTVLELLYVFHSIIMWRKSRIVGIDFWNKRLFKVWLRYIDDDFLNFIFPFSLAVFMVYLIPFQDWKCVVSGFLAFIWISAVAEKSINASQATLPFGPSMAGGGRCALGRCWTPPPRPNSGDYSGRTRAGMSVSPRTKHDWDRIWNVDFLANEIISSALIFHAFTFYVCTIAWIDAVVINFQEKTATNIRVIYQVFMCMTPFLLLFMLLIRWLWLNCDFSTVR